MFVSMSAIFLCKDTDFLTLSSKTSGSVVGNQVVNLRCRCITKERKPIGRRIVALEVHPVSSHCAEIQIIATLKMEKRKVCLDPKAPWVQKVLKNRIIVNKQIFLP
uniref:Chemokine interleukin-8-like domain-containing protein n=1 Tax=Xiphophorus couchianus TaxID=32473 RepID=A0A3B5M496_9TELE